jgi:hypothetical protein
MKTFRALGPLPLLLMLVLAACMPLAAQDPAVGINFTTWQQDDPALCPRGCVCRTGQNLKEGSLTSTTVAATIFGQLCTLLAGPVSLLGPGETAVNCDGIGAGNCGTVAPNVGILSTPVIKLTGTELRSISH